MRHRVVLLLIALASLTFSAEGVEPATEWTIVRGMTLDQIATASYGHRAFSRMVALYNEVDPRRIPAGAKIKTPPLSDMFKELGLIPEYQDGLTGIFDVLSGYGDLLVGYRAFRQGAGGNVRAGQRDLGPEMAARFNELADALGRSARQIASRSRQQGNVPTMFLGQVQDAEGLLRLLATGHMDGYGYDVDMVFQRLAHALANAVAWSRE